MSGLYEQFQVSDYRRSSKRKKNKLLHGSSFQKNLRPLTEETRILLNLSRKLNKTLPNNKKLQTTLVSNSCIHSWLPSLKWWGAGISA
ncbi:hypothetical protein ACU8KH_05910 [Lachancea thermotolerans]